ncbi:PTS sugar transporter subunit IIA [Paenibacillus sp. FSL R7-0331]|uniref:PTS sugar transporter subunit IIA n=1 Tax=Paenibacillus sp. FSL R7-0331 TaxID=1536773 RepID=UPI0004F84336|nr:PTS glucose transporter subunit IIA [Paenibacillus sp. FSL R7-0331]AIQ51378.1 PTS glucose transporter subunit IIA [Paenibacillus sp. FSL R7-0331]
MAWFKKKEKLEMIEVGVPIAGTVVELSEVPDPAFAGGFMGKGAAIKPQDGKVFSPFDGTAAHVFDRSNHALLLEHSSGIQLLIHVGINTVSLKGRGFTPRVKTGDKIKKGQLLLEFDISEIEHAGLSVITPVLIPDDQESVKSVELIDGAGVTDGVPLLRVHLH